MSTKKKRGKSSGGSSILRHIGSVVSSLENNKLLAGLLILVVNVGSKYVVLGFSKTQEEYLRNVFSRQLLIFAMVWAGTRDIIISLLLTAAFIILSDFIVNPESSLCLLPAKYHHMHKMEKEGALKNDTLVSSHELESAKEVVARGERQRKAIEQFQ